MTLLHPGCTFTLALLLAACGGSGADTASTEARDTAAQAQRLAASPGLNTEPADPGARTSARLYLSHDEAEALARTWRGRVVWVLAEGSGLEAAERSVLVAYGTQAAADLPMDVPFIVRGSPLRQAAAVANRLSANGAPRVFLVTR